VEAVEAIGGDVEHAQAYVDEHGRKSDLAEFADRLAESGDLMAVHEEYRRMNDIHRIIKKWLRSAEQEYTGYTGKFYGDSDDPEPGTYNAVQQKSREMDGNLMFYRAIFPEPQTAYWDSDPVLWFEFPEIGYTGDKQDSHVYVTADFAEQYSEFAIEIDGRNRPVPPANSDLEDGSSGASGSAQDASDAGTVEFDPAEYTIPELEEALQSREFTEADLDALLDLEKSGQARKGAKNAIRDEIDALEADDGDSGNSTGTSKNATQESGDGETEAEQSGAATAGEMTAEGESIPPEKVMELTEQGWTKEEIIELYG
jgi:hypothetical protein